MTGDARRKGECDSTIIFRIIIIFLTEIKAHSFSNLLGSDRVAAILKVYCDENFLL